MKTYHLITTNPPTLHEGFALNSLPPRIVRPEEMTIEEVNEGMPDGYKYVPELDQPEFDDSTHRLVRSAVTLDGYGWKEEALTPEEMAEDVPFEVTRRQLLLTLNNLPAPVTRAGIAALIGDDENAKIEFEEAQTFRRDHPLLGAMALQMGLTDEQVDAIFIQASKV